LAASGPGASVLGVVAETEAAGKDAALHARIALQSSDPHALAADLVRATPAAHDSFAPFPDTLDPSGRNDVAHGLSLRQTFKRGTRAGAGRDLKLCHSGCSKFATRLAKIRRDHELCWRLFLNVIMLPDTSRAPQWGVFATPPTLDTASFFELALG
jgi:hypothetical protein